MREDLESLLQELLDDEDDLTRQTLRNRIQRRRESLQDARLDAELDNLMTEGVEAQQQWRRYTARLDRIDGTNHRTQAAQYLDRRIQQASLNGYLDAMEGKRPNRSR